MRTSRYARKRRALAGCGPMRRALPDELVDGRGRGRIEPHSGRKRAMSIGSDLIRLIAGRHNLDDYQKKHWTSSFSEYFDIVRQNPRVARPAYQRISDMIVSDGAEEVVVNKEKLLH